MQEFLTLRAKQSSVGGLESALGWTWTQTQTLGLGPIGLGLGRQWISKPSPARVHLLEIIFISGYNICEYYYHINNDLHNYFIFIYYL